METGARSNRVREQKKELQKSTAALKRVQVSNKLEKVEKKGNVEGCRK